MVTVAIWGLKNIPKLWSRTNPASGFITKSIATLPRVSTIPPTPQHRLSAERARNLLCEQK